MAFCNSCGANIEATSRFCNKCGAPILASTLPSTGAATVSPSVPVSVPSNVPGTMPAANPPHGGGALKIILIAVGVIVLLGAIGIASAAFFALRVARHAHVRQDGDNVKVETPFGSIEASKDPDEAARNLGVDLYPGAEVLKEGAASASVGGIHTVTLNVETIDSVDKVSEFYKEKFPDAQVTTSDASHCTIVSKAHGQAITINIESVDDKTKIHIASASHR